MGNNVEAFFSLIRAGLWETRVDLNAYGKIDFQEIFRLAEEQSVIGLVAAGLEFVSDTKIPKDVALTFAGAALQLERRNTAMNLFLGELVEKMRKEGIYTLLLKGQGLAQCYERPLWRASGDIDFFLSNDNYQKAKQYLSEIASRVENENAYTRHLAMTLEGWEIEIHGTLRSGLRPSIDKVLDKVLYAAFYEGKVRSWMDGRTQVFLMNPDEDVVYVFTHILQHFYKEGIGLRQICDWCRLLWTYREKFDLASLKDRLKEMGCQAEWNTFAAFAVEYLGMSEIAIPFYHRAKRWQKKAKKIQSFVMKVGNFGHNEEKSNNHYRYPAFIRKLVTMWRGSGYVMRHFTTFPLQTIKVFNGTFVFGIRNTFSKYVM